MSLALAAPDDGNKRMTGGARLTLRELEVLVSLAEGDGAKATAERLCLSTQTIKNHLINAYRKLGVCSLVGAYRKLGWLQTDAIESALRLVS